MSPYRQSLPSAGEERAVHGRQMAVRESALLEEMSFIRREAQAEANLAYEDWRMRVSSEAYAVYRAAQDRADSAQDDLAELVSLISRR
jgi:hypothetical protein